jgi:hypothetical protein
MVAVTFSIKASVTTSTSAAAFTYHSRFIAKGVAEAPHKSLRLNQFSFYYNGWCHAQYQKPVLQHLLQLQLLHTSHDSSPKAEAAQVTPICPHFIKVSYENYPQIDR